MDLGIPSPRQTRGDLKAITVPPDVELSTPLLIVGHEVQEISIGRELMINKVPQDARTGTADIVTTPPQS